MSAGVVKGARVAEVAFVAAVVLLIASIAIPSFFTLQKVARRGEAKQSLHDIQLCVERFAVDTEGAYPPYLIGGSGGYRDTSAPPGKANTAPVTLCQREHLSDPLLRKGYITQYPRNPFARDGLLVHATQEDLPTSITGNDPLRNGSPDGKLMGTRFGPDCNLMGSVLCDPRFEKWGYTLFDTWAIVEYPYWDAWTPGHFRPFLPGEFFYKGEGPEMVYMEDTSGAPHPVRSFNEHLSLTGERIPAGQPYMETDFYMLGCYGAVRDKGADVLGPEPLPHAITLRGKGRSITVMPAPSWTRSQYSVIHREGSPYGPTLPSSPDEQLRYGNPNGIRDGIVLMLTAGEDIRTH